MKRTSLIPFVCGAGASVAGAEHGALYAHTHGLAKKLDDCHWAVDPKTHWQGPYGQAAHENLPPQGSTGRLEIVRWHLRALAENISAELRKGNRAVTIGGDHTLSAASVAGVQAALGADARLGLMWIDAHPDMHTFRSSVSKALHGMPLGTLTGLDDTLAIGGEFAVKLKPENIVFAGLRDIDEGESENAKSLGITLLTMEELRAKGIAESLRSAAAQLGKTCDHIILSVDLDAFAIDSAPAVGSPVPGGFKPDEILPVLAEIARSYSVPLIDVVEFNPTLPEAEKTFDLLKAILVELLH